VKVVVEGVQADATMTVKDVSVTTTMFETGAGKRVLVRAMMDVGAGGGASGDRCLRP
jgi:hypothetical protein